MRGPAISPGRGRPGRGRQVLGTVVMLVFFGVLVEPSAAGPQKSFAELQALVDRAAPGAVVTVVPGTYTGELVIRRPLTLLGKGATLVHREGAPGPTLWVAADDVRVVDLAVVGTGEGTRRDHTAVVVTGHRAVLEGLVVRQAWAGVWIDGARDVTVARLTYRGLADFPFWQRGDGVRASGARGTRLFDLDLQAAADGVYLEETHDTLVRGLRVEEARYGVHVMFGARGRVEGAATRRTVVGFMAMETADWVVTASRFTEGYRTGSAGARQIRTRGVRVEHSVVSRQATGFELLDAQGGLVEGNRIEENGVAWALGGDNGGTRVRSNIHRSNLIDLAAQALTESDLVAPDAHNHTTTPGAPSPPSGPSTPRRPTFDGNYWDSWSGWDLGDGRGDTPHLVDPRAAERTANLPWSGVFLGSPWTTLAATIPGGEVIDPHPLVNPPVGGP